ncbi:hypothetical protein ACQ4PT_069259 [Festuca glaucescens]
MAAVVDALRVSIIDGARWIPSLTQHRADSSGGEDDDDESGHPNDQHLGSGEVVGIGNKMVIAFKGVIQRTSNDIRSIKESTIHPATLVLILVLEFFSRNRDMVQSILESGYYNSDMVNCLISKLNECAETSFQEKGQGCIFVMNNICYVLQNKGHPELLSPSVESKFVSLADEYIKRYLQESWFPLIPSYLYGDSLKKPHGSSLHKFLERFFSICKIQRTWKVQTELKKKLREEMVTLIVPKYLLLKALQESRSTHFPSWLKGMCRARSVKTVYEAEHMEEVIRNLFER